MCPFVEDPHLVLQETGDSQGPTHSRLAECGSRPTIQTWPVTPSKVFSVDLQQVVPTSNKPF